MAMGFTSATLGLCGLIFSQINDHFFKAEEGVDDKDDTSTYQFLLFLSIVTSIGMLIPSFVLGPLPNASSKSLGGANDEVVYQEIRPYNPSDFDMTLDDDACSSNPTLVDEDDDSDTSSNHKHPHIKDDTPLLANNMIYKPTNYAHDDGVAIAVADAYSHEEPSISGLALFTHPIGLTLFLALFVTLGVGYVYLATIGQILLALPALQGTNPQHIRNTHVSLFSIANCAARAFFGTLSDVLKNQFGIHRLWVYWGGLIGLVAFQLYLVTGVTSSATLIPCTLGMALVYGLAFGIAPAATAEFGTDVSAIVEWRTDWLIVCLFGFCLGVCPELGDSLVCPGFR